MARLSGNVDSDGDDEDMYTDPFRNVAHDQEFSSPRTGSGSVRSRTETPASDQENPNGRNSNGKRVRFDESDLKLQSKEQLYQNSQSQHSLAIQTQASSEYYDPDQDQDERRKIRRIYRDLHRNVTDNKTEYLKDNNALIKVFEDANTTFARVRQTADATLDSKLLVTAADLAQKCAEQMTLGVKGTSLDPDDFLSKSIRFLQKSKEHSQLGGAFDWTYFGQEATSICCRRPPLKDFMMGPLAVQKKQRIIKQRRARQVRDNRDMVKPQELKAQDLAKNENSTMKNTTLVAQIFEQHLAELETDRILYFKFVINPHSFAQTIENMFYTAFIVRDGHMGLEEDEDGLPYLVFCDPATPEIIREQQIVRKQIVFSMDKKTWRELIKVFDITEPVIPTRARETQAIGKSGWYA